MTDDNVVDFPGSTTAPINPELVLTKAGETDLKEVIVLGWTKPGELYISSSSGEASDILFLMELAKAQVLSIVRGQ